MWDIGVIVMKEKIFVAFGCSFTWGQGLYYYNWLTTSKMSKEDIKNFMILDMKSSHSHHPNIEFKLTENDLQHMKSLRYTNLISEKLKMDYITKLTSGGYNLENIDNIHNLLNDKYYGDVGPKFNNSINNDKLLNKEIEFIVLQLTHAERDLGWTSNDEKINTLGEFFCSDNWSFGSVDNITTNVEFPYTNYNKHLQYTLKKVREIYTVCMKKNIQFLVWSWPSDLAYIFKDEPYFLKIPYQNIEYDSYDDLIKSYPKFYLSGELKQFGIPDQHPSKHFHELISKIILNKVPKR